MLGSTPHMTRLLLLVCLLVGGAAPAAPEEPWVAVLRTSSAEDEALVGRVRGQLSDLPVVLRVRPAPAPGPSAEEQWRAAEALATEDSARVVLWFTHLPDALSIHLADLSTQRLLVRRVPGGLLQGRTGRSASAEAAALVVRSALSALLDGVLLGIPVVDTFTPPLRLPGFVALPSSLREPVFSEPLPAGPPVAAEALAAWALSVGWQAALDGYSPSGQHGVQLGGSWERTWLRARVRLLASLPAHRSDAYTRVSLSRHAVGAAVEAAVVSTPRWRMGAGVGAGVAGFLRGTAALVPGITPAPARLSAAPYIGPELSARWLGGSLTLEASLAVDVLAGVPTFVYQQEGELLVRDRLWVVQPRFGLAMLLNLF